MSRYITDNEFGPIFVRRISSAKSFTFRVRENMLHVSVPKFSKEEELIKTVDLLRPKLRNLLKVSRIEPIGLGFSYCSEWVSIETKRFDGEEYASFTNNRLIFHLNPAEDYSRLCFQRWIKNKLVHFLMLIAKEALPCMVEKEAKALGLIYSLVKVGRSRTQWGNCNSNDEITLSCFLLLLPKNLVRYVILHELAHLSEMNHSSVFWNLLDSYTQGNCASLMADLKKVKLPI